jgi:hypothetical protein
MVVMFRLWQDRRAGLAAASKILDFQRMAL